MFERFTDRARKVLALANQEAQRFHHEYIDTEHLLLGLVKEGRGVGATVLKNLDIDIKKLRREVGKLVEASPDMVTMGKLPQTPRAKKVVEFAIKEARALNHNYVGTEHILLGLLGVSEGIAAQVLTNLGLKLEDARQEVLNLLGAGIEINDVKTIIEEALKAFENSEFDRAIELCGKVLSINPNNIKAMEIRASSNNRLGKYDEAIKQYDTILQKDSNNKNALQGKGLVLLNKKEYDSAYEIFEGLTKLEPDNIIAWHSMGKILFHKGSFDEVIKCLDKAIKINPNNDSSWVMKAKALSKKGKHEDAINVFDEALKHATNKSYVLLEKGIVYREMGKKDEQFHCYDQAIENNPKYIQAYMQKAHVLQQDKQYEEAIECLRKGIDNDLKPEREAVLWHSLASAYLWVNNYEEAYRSINRSLELHDNEHARNFKNAIERDMSSVDVGDKTDKKSVDEVVGEALAAQKKVLAKFKEFLVREKGVPANGLIEERVWVDAIRRVDLDVLFIREGDETLAVIEYFFESGLRQIERENKLLQKYKEQVKLEGCPAYIACLAPSKGERLVDIYQVTDSERPTFISSDEFPDYEELKQKAASEKPEKAKTIGSVATIRIEGIGEVDRLGRDRLVKTLAGMFAHTDCDNGFTMALLGDWGQGKSTLMGLLQTELEEKHKGKFVFATYNAWEYEKVENVSAGIAQEVVKGLVEGIEGWDLWNLRRKFACLEHKKKLRGLVIKMLLALDISLISFDIAFLFNEIPSWYKIIPTFFGLSAVGLPFLNFKDLKRIFEHPLSTQLQTYLKLPDYGEYLGLLPVLKRHIKRLCSLRLDKERKLVVFVDDLDRCNVDHIAKVLDAIRLVMTIPNVIVMIGIDHRIAFKAIRKHYKELADGNDKRGSAEIARDYLGKIIQLPLRLRAATYDELEEYVFEKLFDKNNIVDDTESEEPRKTDDPKEPGAPEKPIPKKEAEKTDKDGKQKVGIENEVIEEQINEAIKDKASERSAFYELVGKFGFSNPRQLLRLHNSFRFLKGFGRGKGEGYDTLDMLRMLFWQEFLHNWPVNIRGRCMVVLIYEGEKEKLAPTVRGIVDKVRDDVVKLFNGENYAELAEFVRIVVLPHSEEGVLDTQEEIEEWRNKREEGDGGRPGTGRRHTKRKPLKKKVAKRKMAKKVKKKGKVKS